MEWRIRSLARELLESQRAYNKLKYYMGKERAMFEEELKELETVYLNSLVKVNEEIEHQMPCLVAWMKEFVTLYERREMLDGKLETLWKKRREEEDE